MEGKNYADTHPHMHTHTHTARLLGQNITPNTSVDLYTVWPHVIS